MMDNNLHSVVVYDLEPVEVFLVEGNWLIVLTYHHPQLGMAGIGMNFER